MVVRIRIRVANATLVKSGLEISTGGALLSYWLVTLSKLQFLQIVLVIFRGL